MIGHRSDFGASVLRSRLMLGLSPTGGIYHRAFPTEAVVTLIHRAVLHYGVICIDTAPWYGCGKSEMDLRVAIESLPPESAAALQLFTKVGRVTLPRSLLQSPDQVAATAAELCLSEAVLQRRLESSVSRDTCYAVHSDTSDLVCVEAYTPEGLQASWNASTARLGPLATSLVKSLRLHDADTPELIDEVLRHNGLQWLRSWAHTEGSSNRSSGASLGLNHADVALMYLRAGDQLEKSRLAFETVGTPGKSPQEISGDECRAATCPRPFFSSVMVAGCWNLLDQTAADLLVECEARGVEVHLAGVFAAGFLWGGKHYRYAPVENQSSGDGQDQQKSISLIERRAQWAQLAEEHLMSLPALALQFAFLPKCVSYVAIGCATVAELDGCFALVDQFLPTATFVTLLRKAAKAGLITPTVATMLSLD